jgi:hypothetical protein
MQPPRDVVPLAEARRLLAALVEPEAASAEERAWVVAQVRALRERDGGEQALAALWRGAERLRRARVVRAALEHPRSRTAIARELVRDHTRRNASRRCAALRAPRARAPRRTRRIRRTATARSPGRSSDDDPEPVAAAGAGAPSLVLRVELEESPRALVLAASAEDERRLRVWLARPAVRRRLLAALEDVLDLLERKEAAA